jgi:hypothetical protein
MLEVKKTVGKAELRFVSEGRTIKEDIINVSWLTAAPDKCGVCGSPDIVLEGHTAKDKSGGEFTYCSYKCTKCNSSATLGEYKKGGLFLKSWVKYEKKTNSEQQSEANPFN